jgi:hypothetical protein
MFAMRAFDAPAAIPFLALKRPVATGAVDFNFGHDGRVARRRREHRMYLSSSWLRPDNF